MRIGNEEPSWSYGSLIHNLQIGFGPIKLPYPRHILLFLYQAMKVSGQVSVY
jgi:hypothetical protein